MVRLRWRRGRFLGLAMACLAGPAVAQAAPSLVRTAAFDSADQVTLAGQLELGIGVQADPPRALGLYCRAAFGGNRTAILHLVGLLLADPLDAANNAAAAAWLHRLQYLERGILPPRGASSQPCREEPGPGPLPAQPGLLALAGAVAQDAGVDGSLVRAIIGVESAWELTATSPKGAMGLMQIMPFNFGRLAVTDPFDATQNVRAGTAEIARLLGVYRGDISLAIAAYNAGEGAVSRCGCVPENGETPLFVSRVRALMVSDRGAPGR